MGHIDVDGARRQIAIAREAGVNLIDTADLYSEGLSEEIVGKALGTSRDDILITTKVRMPMGDGPNDGSLRHSSRVRSIHHPRVGIILEFERVSRGILQHE